jgi:hypothetical protein
MSTFLEENLVVCVPLLSDIFASDLETKFDTRAEQVLWW